MAKEPKKDPKIEAEKTSNKGSATYGAKDIFVLEGLEPVRKRPGMYIGTTGPDGLHHLIREVVDNSIDEAMAGYATEVTVELLPNNVVAVTDNGRGIPVEIHPQTKKSTLETVLTTLHAGGKFGGEGYKVSGGLHGVGVSVVNALSEWMKAEIYRDGGIYVQEYVRGVPKGKVKNIGKSKTTGTKITFSPDPQIFPVMGFNDKQILDRLRQQAYLTKGIRINFFDRRGAAAPGGSAAGSGVSAVPVFYGFYFEGGLLSFVKYLARNKNRLHEDIFYVEKEVDKMNIEVAFLYVDDTHVHEMSFANTIYTPDGGTQLTGFRSALTRSLNNFARAEGYLKEKEENLTSEDVREGLVAVVSVKLGDPQFEGQTKNRLGNPEVQTATQAVVGEALKEFLEKHPQEARAIIAKVILTAKARLAAKAARDTVLRKGAFEGLTLPGKLADCTSKSPADSELFIVEGDSAGGCFSGDTKVALVDGRNLSFEELVAEDQAGKKNYAYTIGSDGNVAIAPIMHPRRTKQNAEVIRVTLDNGETIVCTPDHRFMLRDGSYRAAGQLVAGDSLMPLYRQHSRLGKRITIKGYEMVFQSNRDFWEFTHLLSDRYNVEQGVYQKNDGDYRHHVDFNKLNNNPENLRRVTREEHFEIHHANLDKTLHRSDVIEQIRQLHKTPEFRAKIRAAMTAPKMRAQLSKRAKKQWSDPEYKKYMTEKFLEFYQNNEAYREENLTRLNQNQKEYWNNEENVRQQSERTHAYFAEHPEQKAALSIIAKEQWANTGLRSWRAQETQKQWTDVFRAKRKIAYDETYRRRALAALHEIYMQTGIVDIEAYEKLRHETNDKTLLRWDTIVDRFFDGNEEKVKDAARHYNHAVVSIEHLTERIDVYDIEIAETHNFALASGVFVHNSAKQGRNRHTQAILPLKGKILNVERARLDKMLANAEIRALVVAIGTAIGEEFNLEKLRYHKIVIMTDADVDGAHIRTLLLTLFYRYFRSVVDGGYIYIAQPPLYRIQLGKTVRYAFSDEERDTVIAEMQKAGPATKGAGTKAATGGASAKGKKAKTVVTDAASLADAAAAIEGEEAIAVGTDGELTEGAPAADGRRMPNIQRYKGLGEMNAEQLWETTMNPENRMMLQVTIDDAEKADKLFDTLMGDAVEPRKNFIQANAANVKNLDLVA
jgi:DNA gyrase subunit B